MADDGIHQPQPLGMWCDVAVSLGSLQAAVPVTYLSEN